MTNRFVVAWVVLFTTWIVCASCTPPCGGLSEDCCEMSTTRCNAGLACRGGGCQRSRCVQCGGSGQTCCDTGAPCVGASMVCSEGACAHCGLPGEPCCGSSCASESFCSAPAFARSQCVACGHAGQPCCAGSCTGGLQCQPTTTAGDGTCVACGAEGEVCCAGNGCRNGMPCNANGTCGLCGRPGLACCPGLTCTSPAECFSVSATVHTCSNCGASGEPCCQGTECEASLFCTGGTCQPCGTIGAPCCADGSCPDSGVCSAGVCRDAGRDGGVEPSACTAMSCAASEQCLAYPAAVCTHACVRDADCGPGRACADGLCLPACTPGAMDCDRIGGACFAGIAPFTSLDAPTVTGTPRCLASCFDATSTMPSGFPGCAVGTTCDPVSGQCTAGSPGRVAIGAPCTGLPDCEGYCIPALDAAGVPTGFVGGYCVGLARNPDASSSVPGGALPSSNCAPDGVAIAMPTSGAGDVVGCYAKCNADCDCRIGYACDHDPLRLGTLSPGGACLPVDCSIAPDACPEGSVCYRAGPFSHRLHPVCAPPRVVGDAGLDGGYDPAAINPGCGASDGGMDAGIDAGLDAALDGE